MNVVWALIADLESRGARFEDRGGDLGVIAPRGLLKPEEVETLRAYKPELLAPGVCGLRSEVRMAGGEALCTPQPARLNSPQR